MAHAIEPGPTGDVKQGQYEDVLEDMLKRHDYATDRWRPIKDQGKIDMKYVSGDPWDVKDRRAREDAGRPVITADELGQYTNQVINDVRQHKRAIKVTPIGEGANDKTAEFRQNLFRQIGYRSNEQQAYTAMFQNCVERSYGFVRVKARYCTSPKESGGRGSAFNQELVIDALPNPDLVLGDPDGIAPDASDWQYAWIEESWDLDRYRHKFKHARVRDFSDDVSKAAPTWMDARRIRIAEYFNIEIKQRCLYLFTDVTLGGENLGDIEVFEDDLNDDDDENELRALRDATPDRERMVDDPTVKIYLTNGFEVLEKPKIWPGKTIPIVSCYGKVIYVDTGEGATKQILSLVRLARDPYMLYCYTRACEQEVVGMTPKVPYFVRQGALDVTNKLLLQKSVHEPVAVIEVAGRTDHMPPNTPPEFPQRNPYEPAIQPLEVLAEAARRAIQAAMGISPLPTQAQQLNEKSGVALKEIDDAEQRGSFHLIDSYEAAITRVGAIENEVCATYYDTARDVTIRDKSDEAKIVRINDDDHTKFPEDQSEPIHVGDGEHDVTLSTGPSFDSERDAANAFADTLLQQIPQLLPVIGAAACAKLTSLSVKLKNLGPIGDEIVTLLSPPEPQQGMVPAAQVQQLQAELQKLQQAISEKTAEIAAKGQADIALENVKGQWALKRQIAATFGTVSVADAKIDAENARTAEESFNERALAVMGARETAIDRAHDAVMKHLDQRHEASLAEGQVGHDAAMLALEHAHSARIAQTPPPIDPNAVAAGAASAASEAPAGQEPPQSAT